MNDMGLERWVGVAAGLAVGVGVLYYLYGPRLQQHMADAEEEPPPVAATPPPAPPPKVAAPADQAPKYPVPEAPAAQAKAPPANASNLPPSPDLAVSDGEVRSAAAEVFGVGPVESFLVPDRIVQNFVTTVDSLDREPVPLRFRLVAHVPEVPVVEKHDGKLMLSSDNDERYRLLADALRVTSAQSMARLYLRYYPLLQRAYREMGYPGAHFNDRVVQVIDHLLAAPEVEHPIELVRPKVLYEFADPELEALSSGQKIMVRIGPANATITKARLRELRGILTAGSSTAPAAG